ncbi:Chondroitin AC/alginate lyase [Mycena indigotica]|uniref:Chondroitin AC/alginate lyase n=1 Tax=Mycena indigotica TaxID=2126181 RepID=A0A8H6SDH7_9AGAR|nr:Chondroitin AC/alginate lyase [Mycena indigotica]KAF7297424.1 Chondroitin AC/alginate lyase [Mycena indigotica]
MLSCWAHGFWPFCGLLSFLATSTFAINPFVQYAVDFPDPDFIVANAGNLYSQYNGAATSIIAWAEQMASYGPWSVTRKPVRAPSNDPHDYMSWAPYRWPDCSSVGNKTALTNEEVWKTCPYVNRDGEVNPDRVLPNDFQSFFNLSDAVLYNSIAAVFQEGNGAASSVYSRNVVKFITTWFLNDTTAMNPSLTYAQMQRGPKGQQGTYTGVLDLRGFAKIASGILILRKSKNPDWTRDIDSKLIAWCQKYIDWLRSSDSGQRAASAANNHGTIFVNQFAALQLIVNDVAGAVNSTKGYFTGIYKGQLESNGDQPLEASRTHPWHYRNFNIAGMVTNARILQYADPKSKHFGWNAKADHGATIRTTLDFLISTDPGASGETDILAEVYPNLAAVAVVYGDGHRKYANYVDQKGFGGAYANEPAVLWAQRGAAMSAKPFSDAVAAALSRIALETGSFPSLLSGRTMMISFKPDGRLERPQEILCQLQLQRCGMLKETKHGLRQKGHLKNGREHLRNRAEIIRDLTATATEHNDTYNVVIWHAMDLVRDIGRAKTHFFAMTLTRNHEATNPRAWYSFVDAAVLPLSLLEEKFDNVATMTANEDGSTTETPWSPLAVLKTHDEEMIRKGGALGAALIVAVELSKKEKSKTVAQAVKETSCPGISPMGLWISVKRSVSVLPPVMSNPRIWKACLKNAMDGYAYTMKRTPMPKQA